MKRETQALAEEAAANAKSEDNGDKGDKGDKVVAFAEGTKPPRDTGAFSDETEMNVRRLCSANAERFAGRRALR